MKALSVLDLVEKAKGKNEKLAILKEYNNKPELQQLLDAALNFSRKFNIKKFEVNTLKEGLFLGNFGIFIKLLESLENRTLTGNLAVETVEQFFWRCNLQECKWYSRVLRKDLRAGFSVNTAVKAGFKISKFDVQLAKDGNKCKKLNDLLDKGCYASKKLDGYRCLAIVKNGEVTLHTRNGDTYKNFPTIVESLRAIANDSYVVDGSFIIDGEIMSDTFTSMQQSAFASKRGTTVGDVKFHIFDWIPIEEWETNKFETEASDRYAILEDWIKGVSDDNLVLVEHEPVKTLDDILALEKQYIQEGYEGVMVNPDIPYYKGKKSNRMLKFKTMQSMDCKVTGFYEGQGKYTGMLGGLVVTQENGVSCEVGSGFSDDDRNYIWKNQAKFLNSCAEIKYQDLTEKENRMRFPIILRWRNDK